MKTGNFNEVDGNLITMALEGRFDVIAHGTNCWCTMGAGIAPQMAKAFGVNEHELEHTKYKGDIDKLGRIGIMGVNLNPTRVEYRPMMTNWDLFVVNAYTQYNPGRVSGNLISLWVSLCFIKINHIFKGKHIGIPKIGAGIAGGNWDIIKANIELFSPDVDITVVNYKK